MFKFFSRKSSKGARHEELKEEDEAPAPATAAPAPAPTPAAEPAPERRPVSHSVATRSPYDYPGGTYGGSGGGLSSSMRLAGPPIVLATGGDVMAPPPVYLMQTDDGQLLYVRAKPAAPKGINPEILPSFPYFPPATAKAEKETCMVCMTEFEKGEKVRLMPCLHRYHAECIDPWLHKSTHCPICNQDIKKLLEAGSAIS